MCSGIEIAQSAQMKHIREIAESIGLTERDLEYYGTSKAKISQGVYERLADRPDGTLGKALQRKIGITTLKKP